MKSLVVVQNKETQFDAPLYALIHKSGVLPLKVIYTTPVLSGINVDDELGFSPGWDHIAKDSYPRRSLRQSGPFAIWQLAREIRREQPGLVVICGYFPRSQLLLAIFLRLLGQRIGLRSDNTLSHTTFHGLRGKLRRLGIGPIQRLFHTWHPVSEQAHTYIRTLSGVERPSYRFAYAVDNEWFHAQSNLSRQNRSWFLFNQRWPEDAFVVLGIMKWNHREDPLTLLHAFKVLYQSVPRARLVLVGDGPLREDVHEACSQFDGFIHRPGYVPYSQLPDWYGRADVFVHPAPDEPWGVSVTEALACGVPVIAAEGVGAASEIMQSNQSVLNQCVQVVPNGDHVALAKKLASLSHYPRDLQKLGKACQSIADRWHYRHTIEAFRNALERP